MQNPGFYLLNAFCFGLGSVWECRKLKGSISPWIIIVLIYFLGGKRGRCYNIFFLLFAAFCFICDLYFFNWIQNLFCF